jgi:hypothetical protein
MFEAKITTEQLINEYKQRKQAFHESTEALQQRAIEESGFMVGDIVREIHTDTSYRRNEQPERIISKLIGKINEYGGIKLEVKGATRKRLKSGGWHAVENDEHLFNSKPIYTNGSYWQVTGHEELKDGFS